MKSISALKKEVADTYTERCFFQGEMQFSLLLPGGMGKQAGWCTAGGKGGLTKGGD